jgi:competence protein ComEC
MATGVATAAAPATPPTSAAPETVWTDGLWRSPLVPVALAVTIGIILDRYFSISFLTGVLVIVVALLAWAMAHGARSPSLLLPCLLLALAAFGAAYHHWYREMVADDDVGNFATEDPRPVLLRGILEEAPTPSVEEDAEPLRSIPRKETIMKAAVRATALRGDGDWQPVSGRARLIFPKGLEDLRPGDEIEAVGRLVAPEGPANPGEVDVAAKLRDQRIRARLLVRKTPEAITRLAEGWPGSVQGWPARVRGWGQEQLREYLGDQGGVASALLLGEDSALAQEGWQKYKRTGVIHVLVISGQHVAILGWLLWRFLLLLGVRRSRGAWGVGLFVLAYAFLTGNHPPILRAAVMVCVVCGGLILRRPTLLPNVFALAWLIVALVNPTDMFTLGCQLSFLSVAVLHWGTSRWFQHRPDPLERLLDQSRSPWERFFRRLGWGVAWRYLVCVVIWLVLVPLVWARGHVVSFSGLLIMPPVMLLTSVALLAGFGLLLAAALHLWPLAWLFSWPTYWGRTGCELLVNWADNVPFAHVPAGDLPEWWLSGFYLGLLVLLLLRSLWPYWHWAILAGAAWVCVGLLSGLSRSGSGELRCTFLAVGHGGCTVIETPDGRTLLYDAGSLTGPEVTQRYIAPYLWSRGIRRIDEVFLSHGDLDHFNGIPSLLELFSVGRVSCTPTFEQKHTEGVRETLEALQRHGVPIRILKAKDRVAAGDVLIEVLHPPAAGPEGNENTRSLVLLIHHAGHSLLLTGDLEGAGLERVLQLPLPRVDVLMAPHHGSKVANTPGLARWARPRVVISCQGVPRGLAAAEPYQQIHATFLGTWPHGAVTVRSHSTGLVVETFRTKLRFAVRP